jgi:hypothetical protein
MAKSLTAGEFKWVKQDQLEPYVAPASQKYENAQRQINKREFRTPKIDFRITDIWFVDVLSAEVTWHAGTMQPWVSIAVAPRNLS